ncbi:MAG: DUF2933 domain-containing protein [Deltaproteobacteria bacterium]|nr:DUF2933 domain-containing protein [Deltaproteobacteria bacterium]
MKQFLLRQIKKNPGLAMVICCALPVGAVLGLSYFGVLGSWGYYGLMLLCPLLHLVMCRMGHSSHHTAQNQPIAHSEPSPKNETVTGKTT